MLLSESRGGPVGSLGPFKLQFNNDVMKLKKYFVQSKTRTINSHVKKLKKLKKSTEKTALKEKVEKKMKMILEEIQLIKKLNYKDVVHFFMLNETELNKVMNTPIVTHDKVVAKIASHKSLCSKLQEIKDKFKNYPMVELLGPNPKKTKKKKGNDPTVNRDAKDKKSKLDTSSSVVSTSMFNVEDLSESFVEDDNQCESGLDSILELSKSEEYDVEENKESNASFEDEDSISSIEKCSNPSTSVQIPKKNRESSQISQKIGREKQKSSKALSKTIKSKFQDSHKREINTDKFDSDDSFSNDSEAEKLEKNVKKHNMKTKSKKYDSFEESLHTDSVLDLQSETNIDSFFKTETGDSYVTSVSRKEPEEAKKSEGDNRNRKIRRAVMFGNEALLKNAHKQKKKLNFNTNKGTAKSKGENRKDIEQVAKNRLENPKHVPRTDCKRTTEETTEKLHPSWEAKKQKSAIVQFKGNKIVFDD